MLPLISSLELDFHFSILCSPSPTSPYMCLPQRGKWLNNHECNLDCIPFGWGNFQVFLICPFYLTWGSEIQGTHLSLAKTIVWLRKIRSNKNLIKIVCEYILRGFDEQDRAMPRYICSALFKSWSFSEAQILLRVLVSHVCCSYARPLRYTWYLN